MNKIKLINLIKNKEPLKIYNSNSRLLIISREREISVILSSFLGSALSIKKKIGVFVLSTKKKKLYYP